VRWCGLPDQFCHIQYQRGRWSCAKPNIRSGWPPDPGSNLTGPHAYHVVQPLVSFVIAQVHRGRNPLTPIGSRHLIVRGSMGPAVTAVLDQDGRAILGFDDAAKIADGCLIGRLRG
jgi:hypothetical protein